MPDITMCVGTNCPMKLGCYRHTATPTPGRQSYFAVVPARRYLVGGPNIWHVNCHHFDPVAPKGADLKVDS
jgi:hypothetical protein